MLSAYIVTFALSALEVRLQPGTVHPGDAVSVVVTGVEERPQGAIGDDTLIFWRERSAWRAIVGLPVELTEGALAVSVTAGAEKIDASLDVLTANFRRREISVSKRFTSPTKKEKERSKADQLAFDEAFAQEPIDWLFTDSFVWPRNSEITAPFGDLRLVNKKKKSQHFGVDLDGKTGDPVSSSNAGVVVMVRDCFSTGNTLIVHHGGQLFTAYFHLSKIEVSLGQDVKRGQRLGRVGKTGKVTGPHLHWGVKIGDRWTNPQSLISIDLSR